MNNKASKVMYFISSVLFIAKDIFYILFGILGMCGAIKYIPNGFNPSNMKVAYILLILLGIACTIITILSIYNYILISHEKYEQKNNKFHVASIVLGIIFGSIFLTLGGVFSYVLVGRYQINKENDDKHE